MQKKIEESIKPKLEQITARYLENNFRTFMHQIDEKIYTRFRDPNPNPDGQPTNSSTPNRGCD